MTGMSRIGYYAIALGVLIAATEAITRPTAPIPPPRQRPRPTRPPHREGSGLKGAHMFGTSDKELAEARHLAQEIAERLTRLQEIGTVGVNASRIVTIAGTISYSRTTRAWTLGNGRA